MSDCISPVTDHLNGVHAQQARHFSCSALFDGCGIKKGCPPRLQLPYLCHGQIGMTCQSGKIDFLRFAPLTQQFAVHPIGG